MAATLSMVAMSQLAFLLRFSSIFVAALLFCCPNEVRALRVLVSASNYLPSHLALHIAMADLLAKEGHEVTFLVIQSHPDEGAFPPNEHTNWTRSQHVLRHVMSAKDKQRIQHWQKHIPFNHNVWASEDVDFFSEGGAEAFKQLSLISCQSILTDNQLTTTIQQHNFDVAMAEWFEGCIFALLRRAGIRATVATSSTPMEHGLASYMGLPTATYMPDMNTAPPEGIAMSVWQRAQHFFRRDRAMAQMERMFSSAVESMRPLLGTDFPTHRQMLVDASFVLINTNEFLDFARPISGKIKRIGGFTLDRSVPVKQLSAEMETLLRASSNGAVLVSFGSIADPRTMPADMLNNFLDTFATFPEHTFIWRFPDDNADDGKTTKKNATRQFPANVRTFNWLDQKALLAHPKLRLFISHCGLNSMTEAVLEAVPLLCIPIFGDHNYAAAIVNQRRIGRVLQKSQLNKANLKAALSEFLAEENNQYTLNMRTTSRKIALAPEQPREVLLRHVGFAGQFAGQLEELNLQSTRMNTMAQLGLDFLLPLAAFATIAVVVVARICFLLSRRLIPRYWTLVSKMTKTKFE